MFCLAGSSLFRSAAMPMWISQEDADGKKEWVKLEKLPKDLLSLIQWQSRVYHIVVAGDDDAPILG